MEYVLLWRAYKWEKSKIHTKPLETSASAWGKALGSTEQSWTLLLRDQWSPVFGSDCKDTLNLVLPSSKPFKFQEIQMTVFSEVILLLMSTNFCYDLSSTAAQHLMKKSSSSSRCFCVILEVSVYSTFFQHLTPYSVIHSSAVAALFLNYLKYFLSLPMQFQPETIWFLTQTKRKYKDKGGWGMNGIIHKSMLHWVKYLFRQVLAHPRHNFPMYSTSATSRTHDFLTSVAGQTPLPVRWKLWPPKRSLCQST